jgi:pimeloyl-ACP methyl ester carboxylesterase
MHAEVLDTRGRGPELVYVPGIDGSGELLLGLAERLAPHFRLTRLCYRGDTSGDHATLAASVARCIQGLGSSALVLAESFGVAVALLTALDHPRQVAGLALVNGFARYSNRLGLALTRGAFALAPEAWIHRGRRRFVQRGLIAPRQDERALAGVIALRGDWFDERYRARLRWIAAVDVRPRLIDVRCPVEVFAAEHDRVVDSVRAGRELASALPAARFTLLPRAGHLVLPLAEEPWEERLLGLARRAGLH